MKVDYKSRTSRLYRWFYFTEEIPTDGCLFIKKVIWMYLWLIPYTLWMLPVMAVTENLKIDSFESTSRFPVLCVGFFGWGILFLAFMILSPIGLLWMEFNSHTFIGSLQTISILTIFSVSIVLVVLGIIHLIKSLIRKTRNKKRYQQAYHPKEPSLIVTGYRAWKEKYCPKVEVINKD